MRNHEEQDKILVNVGIDYLDGEVYSHTQLEGVRDGMDVYVHIDELDKLLMACGVKLRWEAVFLRGRGSE